MTAYMVKVEGLDMEDHPLTKSEAEWIAKGYRDRGDTDVVVEEIATTRTFEVTKRISYVDVWEAMWGSDGMGSPWMSKVRKPDGSDISLWDSELNGLPQPFKVYDIEEGKWHQVTLEDIAEAYRLADKQHLTHCGGHVITDFDDPDGCTGDVLLQLAVFGEITYG